MLVCRAFKRVSSNKLSKMFSRLNNLSLSFPSIVFKTPLYTQNPSSPQWPERRIFCTFKNTSSPAINLSWRVSRATRTEAQDVLFDYLHCTRNLSFTDAEHISKNSPYFLQNLLSNVESEKDAVSRSLTKFLNYNPINEFEPFLESLGLSPSEVPLFLPRRLMFLCDDYLMLENFHVLCNYGIPCIMIGKMYKEAREIFGYGFGVLASKLKAYEDLGLETPTVIKLVSCCPSLLIGCIDDRFVKVLENLKNLGIQSDWIGRYVSSKYSYNWSRMLDTMDFLDKVGYREEQMHSLFDSNPSFLLEGSGKKVYVLFGRLLKLGFKTDKVYHLFVENPQILSNKNVKNLLKAVDFLFEIGVETEDIAYITSTNMQLMGSCALKGPKAVCKYLNVEMENLCQIVKDDPLKLFTLASKSKVKINEEEISCQEPTKHLEKTTFLLRLGYIENSDDMAKAMKKFRGRGDQLQERFDCLVKAGLDCNVVTSLIKQAPIILNQTKEVIEEKISCLVNHLGYPLESVVAFPVYLCYNMERINTRFSMYVWLKGKGVVKPNLSLSSILACSDKRFRKYFVDVHPEGATVWTNLRSGHLLAEN